MRKMTVEEFIRESKPDWQPVAYEEKRTSTRPFSGVPTVRMGTGESLQEQADRQANGEASDFLPRKYIDDAQPKVGSKLPGQD